MPNKPAKKSAFLIFYGKKLFFCKIHHDRKRKIGIGTIGGSDWKVSWAQISWMGGGTATPIRYKIIACQGCNSIPL